MAEAVLDEDGDLLLRRRGQGRAEPGELVLSDVHLSLQRPAGPDESCCTAFELAGSTPLVLRHRHATPISLVGLQVWRGSLLLADYLAGPAGRAFEGCVGLELGAGTGLSGLLLARSAAQRVFLTDVGQAVLENLRDNVDANAAASAATRELDWLHPPDWLLHGAAAGKHTAEPSPFAWQPADLEQLRGLRCILAADCVYENDLTEAMMRTAAALLRWTAGHGAGQQQQREVAVLLVALERRVCFTLAEMRECSPAYDFWRSTFRSSGGTGGRQPVHNLTSPPLLGRRIDTGGVPQRVAGSERSELLELWELRLDPGGPAPAAEPG